MADLYTHADGDHYAILKDDNVTMKSDETGHWVAAVLYQQVKPDDKGGFALTDLKVFVTSKKRWAERFTKVESDAGQ